MPDSGYALSGLQEDFVDQIRRRADSAAVAENTQQHQEQVDKVQIQR